MNRGRFCCTKDLWGPKSARAGLRALVLFGRAGRAVKSGADAGLPVWESFFWGVCPSLGRLRCVQSWSLGSGVMGSRLLSRKTAKKRQRKWKTRTFEA